MYQDIVFDGLSLDGFGYMVCDFNNGSESNDTVSNMEYSTVKASKSNISHKVTSSYPNNYTTQLSICKKPCDVDDDYNLSDDDIASLTRWLCRKNYKDLIFVRNTNNSRNIYKNTETMSKSWSKEADRVVIEDGIAKLTCATAMSSTNRSRLYQTPANGNFTWMANVTYTVSFDAWGNGGTLTVYNHMDTKRCQDIKITSQKQRYSVTFCPQLSASRTAALAFYAVGNNNEIINIEHIQLEIGDTATEWQPSWKDDNENEIHHNAKINLTKVMNAKNCIGVTLDIDTNSPYGFTSEITEVLSYPNGTEKNTINVVSDEEGYIIPTMNITINGLIEGRNYITLKNARDNVQIRIHNIIVGETITLYGGDNLQITSTNPSHDFSQDFDGYRFLKLYYEYNNDENIITANQPCTLEIKYKGIRKVGMI